MLKCGQKNNKNYTFGLRKEQTESFEDLIEKRHEEHFCCHKCGSCFPVKTSYCPNCGSKL